MTNFFRADSLIKFAVLGLGAALLLGACGDKNSASPTKAATDGRSVYETPTDHALGDAKCTHHNCRICVRDLPSLCKLEFDSIP